MSTHLSRRPNHLSRVNEHLFPSLQEKVTGTRQTRCEDKGSFRKRIRESMGANMIAAHVYMHDIIKKEEHVQIRITITKT